MQIGSHVLISLMLKRFLLISIVSLIFGQDHPFVMDHPVYAFLERQENLGRLRAEYWNTRPFTYDQIRRMFAELRTLEAELSAQDRAILTRFEGELDTEYGEDQIIFPWSKTGFKRFLGPGQNGPQPHFISYQQGQARGWINWSETFRIQSNGEASRGYHTDHLGIHGQHGAISFTTQFTYYRATKSDAFDTLPESYKEGYILERDEIKWINWDHPTSSLVYTHPNFMIGIHRQPVYWGYSPDNSPILSDNVYPLPHISWSTQFPHLRYGFIHARLSPSERPIADTTNVRRNLAAHRVEFDITPMFEFAFSEMIIYAHREMELAYANPVNFLFAEEHVQGNLDNLIMALEFKWQPTMGFTTYGSWLFDELNYLNLFSNWWGNKFVFQLGLSYSPQRNLPTWRAEITAARPWTYSHQYPVNSYTSAGRVLGLADGPNTQSVRLISTWQVSPPLYIEAEFKKLTQGQHLGSDPLLSYTDREEDIVAEESFLLGDLNSSTSWRIQALYQWTRTVNVIFAYRSEEFVECGINFDW